MAKQEVQVQVPKLKLRSTMTKWHHLFKALVATCKKNQSYKAGEPTLVDVEHVHFFHSINSNGLEQKTTNHVAGHFHEVTYEMGEDGSLFAKCGPAMKKTTRIGKNGLSVTKAEPVKFWDKFANDGEGAWITDKHVHEMHYVGSDEISSKMIEDRRKSNAAAISSLPETFSNAEVTMAPVSTASRGKGSKKAQDAE